MSSAPNRLLRALFLPVLLLAAAPLVAQQTGEILGTVSDSAGAVLPGVERPPFFVSAADGVSARVVALGPDETPVAGAALTVALERRHWESVRRREVSGRYVFESRPVVASVAT